MNKRRILILFGGESSEHDISIKSATNIVAAIDRQLFDLTLCYITRDGKEWRRVGSVDSHDGPVMTPRLGQKSFMVDGEVLEFDAMFPVLHGKHGEDGEVQGLASLLHLPCVGPGMMNAAITMDKSMAKKALYASLIEMTPYDEWRAGEPLPTYEAALEQFDGATALFVKPANGGSSIGVSRVTNTMELEQAIRLASQHDDVVLIEQAIDGQEVEVAVLGTKEPAATVAGEIVPGEAFYTFDDKYAEGSASQVRIPAAMPEESGVTQNQLQRLALDAYRAVNGRGMARVDMFVTADGRIYVNEINAIPGFTNISMYPKLWEHAGVSQTELITRLIDAAFE